jgi:branched-chain amino acid transport system permease protein
MEYYGQLLLNGIIAGSIYALFAVGLTMVYGVFRFINFAHGELIA